MTGGAFGRFPIRQKRNAETAAQSGERTLLDGFLDVAEARAAEAALTEETKRVHKKKAVALEALKADLVRAEGQTRGLTGFAYGILVDALAGTGGIYHDSLGDLVPPAEYVIGPTRCYGGEQGTPTVVLSRPEEPGKRYIVQVHTLRLVTDDEIAEAQLVNTAQNT